MDTTNAVNIPKNRITNSELVKSKPNLTNFNKLAPNITGIAKKKVNSAIVSLDTPNNKPPIMVDPDRETPGNKAAISWAIPIKKAVLKVISAILEILALGFLFSTIINIIPTIINANAIGVGW